MQVRSLGGEDPLEEGRATHSSILAWRSPLSEEPGGLQSIGLQTQTRLWRLNTRTHIHTEFNPQARTAGGEQLPEVAHRGLEKVLATTRQSRNT